MPINAAIELHDSRFNSMVENDGTIVVELAAYLHQSQGRPGIDSGTVWTQSVRLTFLYATFSGTIAGLPDTILDGCLTLSGEKLVNLFVVPLTHLGPTCMYLEFANGIDITICGEGFRSECVGMPSFVGPFIL
ncbi:MAG: hypothetical protein MUC43_09760 [Pirellula sp.]|jgi:hypothetical protein|nr:hypothetical protein [Pirellula sp.]